MNRKVIVVLSFVVVAYVAYTLINNSVGVPEESKNVSLESIGNLPNDNRNLPDVPEEFLDVSYSLNPNVRTFNDFKADLEQKLPNTISYTEAAASGKPYFCRFTLSYPYDSRFREAHAYILSDGYIVEDDVGPTMDFSGFEYFGSANLGNDGWLYNWYQVADQVFATKINIETVNREVSSAQNDKNYSYNGDGFNYVTPHNAQEIECVPTDMYSIVVPELNFVDVTDEYIERYLSTGEYY